MAVAGKVAPVPKGEWAIGTSYNKIDIVTHNKDAYIALQNNIGQEPTRSGSAYWMLLVAASGDNGMFTGTCTTGASTATKVVTLMDTFYLQAGVMIMVKFSYTNTASNPVLNVNSIGNKSIYYNDAAVTSDDLWVAGEEDVYEIYVYDGTYWVWVGHSLNSGGVSLETVAPIEKSPSAHAYAEGDQFFYEGILYKAKTAISVGDTLVVNTNIEASEDIVTQIANAGQGSWENVTEAEYRLLEAISDPVQGTGVYDPERYFSLKNINDDGWVETIPLTYTADSPNTYLVFNATTIGSEDAASIHPTSFIRIAAEASNTKTMPQQGHNNFKPIAAVVDYQDEGECKIKFDSQTVDTDFWLWIRN